MPGQKTKKIVSKTKLLKKKALKRPGRTKAAGVDTQKIKKNKAVSIKKRRKALEIKERMSGIITHYFTKVRAAVVKLSLPLSIGDKIKIKGHTTDFAQNIESLQLDKMPIKNAKKGQEIGLLVNSRVRQGDIVYKV